MRTDDLPVTLTALDSHLSAIAAAVRELASFTCLATETWAFDADGIITRSWHVPYAAVAVTNRSAQDVIVTSSPPGPAAPSSGPGVAIVPATSGATYDLYGHALTLYGQPGDVVTIQVFSRPQPPAWGA